MGIANLLLNRYVIGAVSAIAIIAAAWFWYHGQISAAEQRGYDRRDVEVNSAFQQQIDKLTKRNTELQQQDAQHVTQLIAAQHSTHEVIKYVEKRIPTVDTTACRELSAGWVQLYNAAARSDCRAGSEAGADCAEPEGNAWSPGNVR